MRIATVGGIPIEVHPSLLLAGLGVAAWVWRTDPSALGRWAAVGALLAITVVLHELGHALAAARFGVRTDRVVLYPFGGVAQLRGMPRSLWGEAWVSAAGPAVNYALAAVLLLLGDAHPLLRPAAWANLLIGTFNLAPLYPMDGGRILLAALTPALGRRAATVAVVRFALAVTALAVVAGAVVRSPNAVLVAGFLWWTVRGEARRVQVMLESGMIPERRR